jgi:predicted TPR repeat methyltransferase
MEDAVKLLYEVIGRQKTYIEAYKSLGLQLLRLGRNAEAAAVVGAWLEMAPDSPAALHMLARAEGRAEPTRASDGFVQNLFDWFAVDFDQHLGALGYQAPQHIAGALQARRSPDGALDILDAGCGTGLCGPLVRPFARRLVGVDLSSGMLAQARGRGYDELRQAELTSFLAASPAAFDVIVCCDTLVYFGNLTAPFHAAASALRPGGLFLLTVERADADRAEVREMGYQMTLQGRYAHSEAYLRRELEAAGLMPDAITDVQLRMHHGDPVHGLLVAAGR